jgi:hypothetical protein
MYFNKVDSYERKNVMLKAQKFYDPGTGPIEE